MATRETVDELHKDQSRRLIHILQRLPFGYYKRDHPGSEVQPGHLLHPGDYQALLLTLEHLSKPDRKGRRRLTASARLRKFQEDRNEFDKEKTAFEDRTGTRRGAREAAIEALAVRWGITPEAAKKRIDGSRR